eukprot:4182085-Alexandrium_andersonii.AAC.1
MARSAQHLCGFRLRSLELGLVHRGQSPLPCMSGLTRVSISHWASLPVGGRCDEQPEEKRQRRCSASCS